MPVFQLGEETQYFPPVHLSEPNGLLAVGGDLSSERLLTAYKTGIFPWFAELEPILWWSPDPRCLLFPNKFHVSKSLKQVIRSNKFIVKFDTCFKDVITSCSKVERKEGDGTWILQDMIEAYTNLYHQGYAHSVEVFLENQLVGGLYGISLGACFFGESMFHTHTDASKIALYSLSQKLLEWNFHFIDCQLPTPHLLSLGAEEITRKKYLELLKKAIKTESKRGVWTYL